MNPALTIIIAIGLLILSYILGSIPFGIVIGKSISGIDVREHGSKNIGATNTLRVLGKKVAALVLFCDILKGAVVIIIVKLLRASGIWETPIDDFFYGAIAIVGHCFSCFLEFHGGKAVATGFGATLAISPLCAIVALLIFIIVLLISGYVSIASTTGAFAIMGTGWTLQICGNSEYFLGKPGIFACIFFTFLFLFVAFRHRKNFQRLIRHEEYSFKKKNK